jgi:WD40 repeat protein
MSNPSPSGQSDAALAVILAWMKERDDGLAPHQSEVLAQHPDLAEELRAFFADQEVADRLAQPFRPLFEPPAKARPPDLLGDCKVGKRLGGGGTGDVYLAWQRQARRKVAVKMLRAADFSSADDRERFLSEARTLARLAHPNIVPIYEVGTDAGEPWFSMELAVDNLADRLGRYRGKPTETAELLRSLASAMDFAHKHGILHRDLKPSNILIMDDGAPKVADLGLAKRLASTNKAPDNPCRSPPRGGAPDETTPYSPPTIRGAIVGTPQYMAPEQARGEHGLTTAVDVYGLGAILYACLTGKPPFHAATLEDTLEQVRKAQPVPPHDLDKKIDQTLEAICLKCLDKDPQKRYASAAQLADDLGCFLEGKPPVTLPVSLGKRLYLWGRRQPLAAGLAAGVVLLAVALLAGLSWQIREIILKHESDQAKLYASDVARASRDIAAGQFDQADDVLAGCPVNLRSWDWHYLRRLCRAIRLRLDGHAGLVRSVCYGPRGQRLLTGSKDGTARLWNLSNGEELHSFGGHQGSVIACFIAQGRRVATAGADQHVIVRDARTGKQIQKLKNVGDLVATDRDGRFLATVGRSRRLQVHDLLQGKRLWEVHLKEHEVICLGMDSAGGQLAVASYHGPIRILAVASGKILKELPSAGRCWALAFSRDGWFLAAGLAQPVLWDVGKGKIVRTFSGSGSLYCSGLDFSPDGSLLAGAYRDGQVRVWDVSSGRTVLSPVRPREGVLAAAFSPDGSSLAVTRGRAVTIEAVDLKRLATANCRELKEHRHSDLEALTFSQDGRWLASRSGGGEVVLREVALVDKKQPRRFEVGKGKVLASYRDPTGTAWLVAGGSKRSEKAELLHAWRVDTGKAGAPAGIPLPEKVEVLAVAPEETGKDRFAVLTWTNQVQVMDGRSFSPRCDGLALGYHPGKKLLAVTGSDGRIRLWNGSSEAPVEFRDHRASATAVAFSKDGRLMASGGADLVVCLWDPSNPKPLYKLHGHGGFITGLAFTPDGRRLASCGTDGWIKIWDTRTGSELLTLTGHVGQVSTIAFSQDGLLASCGHDGVVRLWDGRAHGEG